MSVAPYRSTKGIVKINKDRIVSFEEKPLIKGYWWNAGGMVLSRKVLAMLPKKGSLEISILPKLAKNGQLTCGKFVKGFHSHRRCNKDHIQANGEPELHYWR